MKQLEKWIVIQEVSPSPTAGWDTWIFPEDGFTDRLPIARVIASGSYKACEAALRLLCNNHPRNE